MARQNAEYLGEEAAGVQHIQAVQRQQRLAATQRQRAEQRRVLGGFTHQRTARFRLFTRADKHRNIAAHGRQQGRRVQHFGAKGGHFRCLFKGDDVDAFRRRRHARIGSINPRDIGPDIDAGGIQRFAEQSGGIIAAAAAEGGGAAFRFAADKALGHHQAFRQARRQLLLGQFGDGGDVRFGAAKAIVSAQHFTGVKPLRLNTALTQDFHKQQGGHQFAMADQFVGQGGRGGERGGFRQRRDIFQQALNLFADHVGIAQTLQNIELDLAQSIQLGKTFGGFQPSR